jgi:hypothetical protein
LFFPHLLFHLLSQVYLSLKDAQVPDHCFLCCNSGTGPNRRRCRQPFGPTMRPFQSRLCEPLRSSPTLPLLPLRLVQWRQHPLLFHLYPRRPFLFPPQCLQFRCLRSSQGVVYLGTEPLLREKCLMLARLSMEPLSIVPGLNKLFLSQLAPPAGFLPQLVGGLDV